MPTENRRRRITPDMSPSECREVLAEIQEIARRTSEQQKQQDILRKNKAIQALTLAGHPPESFRDNQALCEAIKRWETGRQI